MDTIYFYIFLFSFFSLAIKLSAAVFVFGCIVFVLLHRFLATRTQAGFWTGSRRFICLVSFAFLFITVTGMVRGVMLSGAPLYPSKVGYNPHLKWAVPEQRLELEVTQIRSFARRPTSDRMKYYTNWKWLPHWIKENVEELKSLSLSGILGCILLLFFPLLKTREKEWLQLLVPMGIILAGVLFWFFSAPAVRFGYGYLVSLSTLLLAFPLYKWSAYFVLRLKALPDRKAESRSSIGLRETIGTYLLILLFTAVILVRTRGSVLTLALILLLLLLALIKFPRRIEWSIIVAILLSMVCNSHHTHYLRRQVTSGERFPQYTVKQIETEEGVSLYRPRKGDQCWDCPLMCSPKRNTKLRVAFSKNGVPRMFHFEKNGK
ncbi:MAG: hypothetical protein GY765_05140 [bacterium]|nr:hypothetical protein [bacterium]